MNRKIEVKKPLLDRSIEIAERISFYLDKVVSVPCALMAALMAVIVLLGVFFRYVLLRPLMWTEEGAIYSMMWMGFLGISSALIRGEHVRLQFIIQKFPPQVVNWIDFIIKLCIAFYLVILTGEGYIMTREAARTQISPALGLSMAWPLASVPVAGFLTLIQLSVIMLRDVRKLLGRALTS